MNRKKFLVIGLLGLFVISMFAGVMAQETAEEAGARVGAEAKSIGTGIRAFFTALFGGVGGDSSSEWLSLIFFALLLGMFMYTALKSFFDVENKFIVWGATIAATGLALIAIPAEYLTALRTSYGAMGLTILAVIPFVIIFAFTLKVKNKGIARGTWVVFTLYYFWLYMATLFATPVAGEDAISKVPYVLALLVGVAMFFFIGWFRIMMFKEKIGSKVETAKQKLAERKVNREVTAEHEKDTTESLTGST